MGSVGSFVRSLAYSLVGLLILLLILYGILRFAASRGVPFAAPIAQAAGA